MNTLANGAAVAGLALFLRAVAKIAGQKKLLSKKPLGCNLCMSFWSSVAVTAYNGFDQSSPINLLAAFGIGYALLELTHRPDLPPMFPPG